MSGYAIGHNGQAFTPDGRIDIPAAQKAIDAHNKRVERAELDWLMTGPDKVCLYYKGTATISTWLGTTVASNVHVGPRRRIGFGMHTYRRAVSCMLFGVLYHGWYMESSGDLVRLKRARKQPNKTI